MILFGVNLILGIFWFWKISKTMSKMLKIKPEQVLCAKSISTVFLTWILFMIPTIILTGGITLILNHM